MKKEVSFDGLTLPTHATAKFALSRHRGASVMGINKEA